MDMIIGYARVSKEEQSINRQLDQLKEFGVDQIIQEKITGTKKDRPGITELFSVISLRLQVFLSSSFILVKVNTVLWDLLLPLQQF